MWLKLWWHCLTQSFNLKEDHRMCKSEETVKRRGKSHTTVSHYCTCGYPNKGIFKRMLDEAEEIRKSFDEGE